MADVRTSNISYDAVHAKQTRMLVTPEGVDLQLRLASASDRASAFFLDLFFMLAALFVLSLVLLMFSAYSSAGEVGIVLWLLLFFFLRSFYFTFFEIGPRAATPGKRMLGIRVAARKGGRLSAQSIFARNAMRELEFFVPLSFLFAADSVSGVDGWIILAGFVWGAIFAFFPLFNRDRLRPGDIIAGTWVVKAPVKELRPDIAARGEKELSAYSFTDEQLDAYGIHELHILEDVLRTQNDDTMALVAERIRNKIKIPKSDTEDNAKFLSAYYAGIRQRLETKLLYGVRRRDKTDRR